MRSEMAKAKEVKAQRRSETASELVKANLKNNKDNNKLYATAGGFMPDDDEPQCGKKKKLDETREKPGPIILEEDATSSNYNTGPGGFAECLVCKKEFPFSYLFDTFDYTVCDECRDVSLHPGHGLITRSEAKENYLLKDEDLDFRKPVLKFVSRKNPHNPTWGDMKLYLRAQIEARCVELHGSLDALQTKHEARVERRRTVQQKRAEKKLAELRKAVKDAQSGGNSALERTMSKQKRHEHKFGQEQYDEQSDIYYKVCEECDFKHTYEKL